MSHTAKSPKQLEIERQAEEADRLLAEYYGEKPNAPEETTAAPEPVVSSEVVETETPQVHAVTDTFETTDHTETSNPAEGSPDLEAQYKELVKKMNAAQRAAADAEKRAREAELRQIELERKRLEIEQAIRSAEEAASKRMVPPEPEPEEDLSELEREMPEVAKLAEVKAKKMLRTWQKEIEGKFSKVENLEQILMAQEKSRQQAELEAKLAKAHSAILARHPDAIEVTNTEAFAKWIDEQHPYYGPAMRNYVDQDPRFITKILDEFKHDLTPVKSEAKKPSPAAMAVPSKGNTVPSSQTTPDVYTPEQARSVANQIHRMSPKDQEAALEKLDRTFKYYANR